MNSDFASAYFWTSRVVSALRQALEAQGFDEILPAILSERYEPGARHAIAVLGDRARPGIAMGRSPTGREQVTVTGAKHYYLPVSHCVEKQLALEYATRVYCIAPCLRLLMEGEDVSGRHLYTFFQAEIEWRTEDVEDVYDTIEAILSDFSERLLAAIADRPEIDEATRVRIARLAGPYAKIPFREARGLVADIGGAVNPHATGDLTHAEEHALSVDQPAPFWLTDYPDGVRDSLYRRRPDGTFATYDLVLPEGYGELATGGLRPDSPEDILRQARRLGEEPHKYYAQWKGRTTVQTGGIGFGIERLIRYCAGASSVLDLRVAHDQGPNAEIDKQTAAA